MPDGLRMSLTTLTALPFRGPSQVTRREAGRAMEVAPLVGVGLGLAAGLVLFVFRGLQPSEGLLAPVLAIATLALLTRGLHLDGLADLADGLGSRRDPAGARVVMKAPDIGPFGVVSLVLVLLVQVTALHASVLDSRGTAHLVLSVAVGRLAMTAACHRSPAATTDGLGALVAGTVRRGWTTLWAVLLTSAAAGYAFVDPHAKGEPGEAAIRAVVAVSLAMLVARALRRHAERRVGGVTGDVLGAICEVATAISLVALSCSPSWT